MFQHTVARTIITMGAVLAGNVMPTIAHATLLSIDNFVRVSDAEFLSPRFDIAGGQTSSRTYTGFVEILVEGSGFNNINTREFRTDAFYDFLESTNEPFERLNSSGFFSALDGSSLRLGTQIKIGTLPGEIERPGLGFQFVPNCALHLECSALQVADLAEAYASDAFSIPSAFDPLDVDGGFVPVYSPDHSYRFVIDVGSYEGSLTLGYGDGGTFNNSSDTYDITLYQASLVSVPEPATVVLFIIGLVGLGFFGWRRKELENLGKEGEPFSADPDRIPSFGWT